MLKENEIKQPEELQEGPDYFEVNGQSFELSQATEEILDKWDMSEPNQEGV